MALSQSQIERSEGDIYARRTKVAEVINGRTGSITFGPMTVNRHPSGKHLAVYSPDGDFYEIRIPDEKAVEAVEYEIRDTWEEWLEAL